MICLFHLSFNVVVLHTNSVFGVSCLFSVFILAQDLRFLASATVQLWFLLFWGCYTTLVFTCFCNNESLDT